MKTDTTVFELIEKEHQRQLKGIELIASENFVSDEVMKAMGSWLTNKYAEGYPGKRYYGGCQVVDEVESLAIERVCKLFGAEYANVQPHSGAQANAAVFLACLKPGDTFMGLNLDHGGHLSHGSAVNTSGILYHAIGYNLNKETGRVDYDEMEKLALEHRPKMIIGGGSAYSREWNYARMREIADKVGAIFMVDMAHPAGLIAAGLLENPVKYAHIVTSTTHKTLRGPRGGIILMGKDFDNPWGLKTPKGEVKKMSQLLNSAVFPGIQGGPLEHVIAAKAVAFNEAFQPEFKEWAKQVQKNAKVLADELMKRGFDIVSGGTDNHSMLVDLRSKYPDLTIQACAQGGGRANYGVLPYFDEFWVSDNTDALQRVYMQWGTSYFFPAIAMASHISATPNHQTFRTIPLKFRIDVAMSGRLGMEIQPKDMTGEEKELCRKAIAEYKEIRPVVQLGDIYRLVSPYDKLGVASLMYTSPEKDKAVFYWWKTEHFRNQHLPRVKMAGLNPQGNYRIRELNRIDNQPLIFEGQIFSGAYLMANGLEIPYDHLVDRNKKSDYSSRILYLLEVSVSDVNK